MQTYYLMKYLKRMDPNCWHTSCWLVLLNHPSAWILKNRDSCTESVHIFQEHHFTQCFIDCLIFIVVNLSHICIGQLSNSQIFFSQKMWLSWNIVKIIFRLTDLKSLGGFFSESMSSQVQSGSFNAFDYLILRICTVSWL